MALSGSLCEMSRCQIVMTPQGLTPSEDQHFAPADLRVGRLFHLAAAL